MRLLTLLALATTALAIPASQLHDLHAATIASDLCKTPSPGNNCAGAAYKDVIIQYGQATADQRQLVIDVVKSSGSEIIHDYNEFGFSGLVPEPVVEIVKIHGQSFELTVLENACFEIPWCGEAPC